MQNTSREKILILVKTYPTPSTKYVETVCTAGIRADGSWVRIFPVPFRSYKEYQRYMKYQWVECSIYKSDKDKRPESFHIDQTYPLELGDHIGTEEAWEKRRRLVLDKVQIFTRQSELLEASRTNAASLAVFKPTALKLHWSTAEIEEIEPHRLAAIKAQLAQRDFFRGELLEARLQAGGTDTIRLQVRNHRCGRQDVHAQDHRLGTRRIVFESEKGKRSGRSQTRRNDEVRRGFSCARHGHLPVHGNHV